jgi:hypothetical protein
MQTPTICKEILATYRGWNELTRSQEPDFIAQKSVVIADVAHLDVPPFIFSDEAEIHASLVGLLKRENEIFDHLSLSNSQYTIAKLNQSVEFIESKKSKSKPSRSGIEARGVIWTPVPDEELQELKDKFEETKKAVGLEKAKEFTEHPYYPANLCEDVKSRAMCAIDFCTSRFPQFEKFDFALRMVDSPASWRMLVTNTGSEQLTLAVNKNPLSRLTNSAVSVLAFHEVIGHMLHVSTLAKNEKCQQEIPHLLAIAIHTQDAFLVEGVAQIMTSYVIKNLLPEDKVLQLSLCHYELDFACRQRNSMDLINEEIDPSAAAERHFSLLGGDPEILNKTYAFIADDLFFSSQILNYHSSMKTLSPFLNLNIESFSKALKYLMSSFHSAQELKSLYASRSW